MKKNTIIAMLFMLLAALMLAACDGSDNDNTSETQSNGEETTAVSQEDEQPDVEVDSSGNEGGIEGFLEQINNGSLPKTGGEGTLNYGLGYFLYYAQINPTGLDNLIYNGLVIHKQLADGEISADSLTNGQQNLLDITDGIVLNPDIGLTDQIGQSVEAREAILARLTADQKGMSPEEALDSNEVVGIAALNSGADIGRKYLVYGQDTPDSDFEFIGVIIVVDASGVAGSGQTYSFQGWDSLPLLGDSSGPFWNDIPTGVSGDPANTAEGRPGVLLISESKYEEIK